MKFRITLLSAVVVALAGCAASKPRPPIQLAAPTESQRDLITKAVVNRLKDPESARFGKIVMLANQRFACAEVNAKNSLGGYTGTQVAGLMLSPKNIWNVAGINDVRLAECMETMQTISDEM